MKKLLLSALIIMSLAACGQSSEDLQNQKQEQLNKQAVESVGMPDVHRFSEKRQLKAIFELRDEMITTFAYTQDMNGHLHKLCDSKGYGIPYATQYTNPMQPSGYSAYAIPQSDPNGLYSPASADGTWIQCLNPKTNKVVPLYVEPKVIVSPFELQNT